MDRDLWKSCSDKLKERLGFKVWNAYGRIESSMDHLIDIEPERIKELKPKLNNIQITDLKTLDYPPLTDDLEEAKSHLDKYGMALIKDVLSQEEVEEMDQRLNEQFMGEEKYQVGSKIRGDEGFGIESSEKRKSAD